MTKRERNKKAKRITKDFIDKFMKENDELFNSLANNTTCPRCQKIVSPPFYNLGKNFNSFEGCKKCFEEIKNGI